MKRALWITAIPPCFDAGGGGEIRQAHLLHGLAQRFSVSLLLAGKLEDERVRADLERVWEVPAVPLGDLSRPLARRARELRWQLLEREPDEVARQRPVRAALRSALPPDSFDVVCVEYIGLAGLLPRRRRGVWSLTLHNLTSEMARHRASLAPGPRQRAMLALERHNAARLERWSTAAYDLVITPSAEDAARLSPTVAVIPNGVDVERFRALRQDGVPAADVVFTGALHTQPNRDGIVWFSREVWPRVRARRAAARLQIVGSAPPAEVEALGRLPGVSVHGDVPDVAPYLAGARVAVVPLRIGTGTRLKALEAMAAGVPVVGTTIGLAGLDLEVGRDVLVADEPEGLAGALLECLEHDDVAGRLAAAARTRVEARYSWARIRRDYAELIEAQVPA